MNALFQLKGTTAFFVQSALSFTVATAGVGLGIAFMPAPTWIRAFLALGMLYVITSTFTLAKVIRDRQEAAAMADVRDRPSPPGPLPPNAPYVDASGGSWV
ncbi:yiaA/B two helix domain-containing protein [Thermomonospora echinospora]|uniref:YiaA/B two helix domain-containing protein n=1 Tax=Thermomonospora echinospora TaxID=1992 RepID=A0A1H6D2G0_9ACTN|nr:YiaA/YiaB family inner membrane protein [Thermomonospora echinospora]SEG79053.1 yiaA/B two helix domain-containing protein [Thermomonospora echinospora]